MHEGKMSHEEAAKFYQDLGLDDSTLGLDPEYSRGEKMTAREATQFRLDLSLVDKLKARVEIEGGKNFKKGDKVIHITGEGLWHVLEILEINANGTLELRDNKRSGTFTLTDDQIFPIAIFEEAQRHEREERQH